MNNFIEYGVCEGLKHIRYDFIPSDIFMAQAIQQVIKMRLESNPYQWKYEDRT